MLPQLVLEESLSLEDAAEVAAQSRNEAPLGAAAKKNFNPYAQSFLHKG